MSHPRNALGHPGPTARGGGPPAADRAPGGRADRTQRRGDRGPDLGPRAPANALTYLGVLLAFAALGAALGGLIVASASDGCERSWRCIDPASVVPALTVLALVLAAGSVAARVIVDVVPAVRARHRAGYRLRRVPGDAAPRATTQPSPGGHDALSLACWSAVDGSDADRAAAAAALRTTRAICPACDTIVAARLGTCLTCGDAVVARRG